MITVSLYGGLGNQMFQYACGRALASRSGQNLQLETSWFKTYHHGTVNRSLEIPIFPKIFYHETFDNSPLRKNRFQHLYQLGKMIGYDYEKKLLNIYFESNDLLIKNFQAPFKKKYYLNGYWQSEDYFKDEKDLIRKDFTFPDFEEERDIALAEKIQNTCFTSVHFRRTDYLKKKESLLFYECPITYYQKAVSTILQKEPEASFLIFSDDIEWCKQNFQISKKCIFIDWHTGTSSFRDMQMMSLCKHHIIANSSFSWWGAWLGVNPQKTVIAPRQWFRDVEKEKTLGKNIVPEQWIRI